LQQLLVGKLAGDIEQPSPTKGLAVGQERLCRHLPQSRRITGTQGAVAGRYFIDGRRCRSPRAAISGRDDALLLGPHPSRKPTQRALHLLRPW
jgi:hypothetical protein